MIAEIRCWLAEVIIGWILHLYPRSSFESVEYSKMIWAFMQALRTRKPATVYGKFMFTKAGE